jgi:hypothetical protein
MASSTEEPIKTFLAQIELGARLFERYHDIDEFEGSDELQLTSMLASVTHWRQRHSEDFAIIHDVSSNFFRGREMWTRITNNNLPPQRHRAGDGSYVEFPLRVTSTAAVDSKDSRSVQFCDILAGFTGRHFNPRFESDDRKFLDDAIAAGLKSVSYNGIRPDVVFPDRIPPKRLIGPDVIDQMTGILFGPHNPKR